ncbi:MAG: hypothetical protein R3B64_03050 [Candidatus Paceibacterota bacterium]|nr:hypothetical protein [Candidatus Nomurabacteria bacterium]
MRNYSIFTLFLAIASFCFVGTGCDPVDDLTGFTDNSSYVGGETFKVTLTDYTSKVEGYEKYNLYFSDNPDLKGFTRLNEESDKLLILEIKAKLAEGIEPSGIGQYQDRHTREVIFLELE